MKSWMSTKEQMPPVPTDWEVKGILGVRIDSGFSHFELFRYTHPDGWVNIKDLLPFNECNITYWMRIPDLPKIKDTI